MSTSDGTGSVQIMAEAGRQIATAGAEEALHAVVNELIRFTEDEEDRPPVVLSQDPGHPGSAARPIDAIAQTAVRAGAQAQLDALKDVLGQRVSQVCYVREETGVQTQLIHPGTLVVRSDALDGTTNAVNLLQAFSCVVTVDHIVKPGARARHLGGAILGGDFDVCWEHWSRRGQRSPGYPRPIGRVYVRSVRLDGKWRRAEVSQDDRDESSVASVAASHNRFRAFESFREASFARGGPVYHLAGNPFCVALLFGRIGAFIETQSVTLHDSVYLIPHWLLGGNAETLEGNPLNYIDLYEENAGNFDSGAKPIPPFVAFHGPQVPFL